MSSVNWPREKRNLYKLKLDLNHQLEQIQSEARKLTKKCRYTPPREEKGIISFKEIKGYPIVKEKPMWNIVQKGNQNDQRKRKRG